MEWQLGTVAEDAIAIAAGLHVYEKNCPAHEVDIAECISKLFFLKVPLITLESEFRRVGYRHITRDVVDDLNRVIPSLQHTLNTCRKAFGRTPQAERRQSYSGYSYGRNWQNLQADLAPHFLLDRLRLYVSFLEGVAHTATVFVPLLYSESF